MPERRVRILHAHSTFSLGGKEARAVRLMNAWGDRAEHVVLSATDQFGARDAIAPGIRVDFPLDAPSLQGKPSPGRYRRLAHYMRPFDLVLTYNWGSMDVVGARRLFGGPPLIHAEDGFNEDEAARQKPARVHFRRLMLPTAHKLVVPSQSLEKIARTVWRQPEKRVTRIANGIPVERFGDAPTRAIPGLEKRPGELVVGTIAGLRAVKNLPLLVRTVCPAAPDGVKLAIVGDGPERAAIEAEARALGLESALVMPGFMADPAAWIGHFDVFALSSHSEQFPISLVEAMAAGLPVVCTDVGDIRNMVSEENSWGVASGDRFAWNMNFMLTHPGTRKQCGAANRAKALADYDERHMIARYADLYEAAIGRPGALRP